MIYKQLTLMPVLEGKVYINKACLTDAAVMSTLYTFANMTHYDMPCATDRFYFNTKTGLSRTPTPYA